MLYALVVLKHFLRFAISLCAASRDILLNHLEDVGLKYRGGWGPNVCIMGYKSGLLSKSQPPAPTQSIMMHMMM